MNIDWKTAIIGLIVILVFSPIIMVQYRAIKQKMLSLHKIAQQQIAKSVNMNFAATVLGIDEVKKFRLFTNTEKKIQFSICQPCKFKTCKVVKQSRTVKMGSDSCQ